MTHPFTLPLKILKQPLKQHFPNVFLPFEKAGHASDRPFFMQLHVMPSIRLPPEDEDTDGPAPGRQGLDHHARRQG